MDDYFQQAHKALTAYLDRGEAALGKLAKGAVDDATELLLWRKAAFHSFRVAESLAAKAGRQILDDRSLKSLWHAIQQVDNELSLALTTAQNRLHSEMNRNRTARGKLKKFHSGHQDPLWFSSKV